MNKLKVSKPSKVLRMIAERVNETGLGVCGVFFDFETRACGDAESYVTVRRARQLFESLYKPSQRSLYWFGEPYVHANVEHRMTALLITAAMAESVGE